MTPDEQTISEILSLEDDKAKIAMIQLYAKQKCIAYGHWILKRVFPSITPTEPTNPEADDLYTLFLNQSK